MSSLLFMLLFTYLCTLIHAHNLNDNMDYLLSSSNTEMNHFYVYETFSDYNSYKTTEIDDFMDALSDTSLTDYILHDDDLKIALKEK
ncbi:hypothetical protein QTN25_008422 [Entamoeba marina]